MIFLLIAVIFLTILAACLVERQRRILDIFSPYSMFLISFFLIYAARPLQYASFYDYDEAVFISALVYIIIGLLCFLLGYHIKIGAKLGGDIKPLPGSWTRTQTVIVTFVLALIGFMTYYLILRITDIGSIKGAFANMWVFRLRAFTMGKAYLAMLVFFCLNISLLVWFVSLLINPGAKIKTWLPFLAYLIVVLAIFSSFGTRGAPVQVILSLIICYHYLKKKVPLVLLSAVAAILFIFVVFAGFYRAVATADRPLDEVISTVQKVPIQSYFYYGMERFDAFPNFLTILEDFPASEMDFQYGRTLLNILVQPVPRAILQEKPLLIGDLFTQIYYPRDVGGVTKDPSIFGEMYMNLHVGGIVIGLFILGIICRAFQVYMRNNQANKGVILFYTQVFGFPSSLLSTGYSSSATISFIFSVAFVWAFLNLIRSRGTA